MRMKRMMIFAKRNLTETLRDVLSYIFCLGFPVVMIIVMSLVNASIPKEANMTIFRIDNLLGGIIVFGQTFLMLFTALRISIDRGKSFMMRMYATPMKPIQFIGGYIVPALMLEVVQVLVAILSALVIGGITKTTLLIPGLLLVLVTSLPSGLFFIAIGLLFGSLFNENAAPGLCSIIISLGSFLGCVWFDAEQTGGVLLKISKCLPFYYCTKSIRKTIAMEIGQSEFAFSLLVTVGSAAAVVFLASLAFRKKMRADLA